MKQIPNLLTLSRILCAVLLLWTTPFSMPFFVLYLLCGMSDMLDGPLARRMGTASAFGALLDSVADFIFITAALVLLIPILPWNCWMLVWISGIVILRLLSLSIGGLRFHTLVFLHTFLNKASGFLLFCFPLLCWFWGMPAAMILAGSFATVSALEELALVCTMKQLDRNRRGWFC